LITPKCGESKADFHGQFGEDSYLRKTIFCDDKTGVFVELGGRDGLLHSNTRFYEECLGWKGAMLEAKPGEYASLCRNRPEVASFNMAAGCQEVKKMDFVGNSGSGSSGLADFMTAEHRQKWNKGGTTSTVDCGPLDDALAARGIREVDLLSLDVEGAEFHVLKEFKWDVVRVHVLLYEHVNLSPDDQASLEAVLTAKSGLAFAGCSPPVSEEPSCFNKIWLSPAAQAAQGGCAKSF